MLCADTKVEQERLDGVLQADGQEGRLVGVPPDLDVGQRML